MKKIINGKLVDMSVKEKEILIASQTDSQKRIAEEEKHRCMEGDLHVDNSVVMKLLCKVVSGSISVDDISFANEYLAKCIKYHK